MERSSPDPTERDAPRGAAQQTMLPLDLPAAGAAAHAPGRDGDPAGDPDPSHDRPIGFALTTRARRAVAPSSLPPLSVVVDRAAADRGELADGALEEPGDTRPARARALRRAGVPVSEIARQLGTDTLTVAAWVGEVAPRSRRPRAPRSQGSPGADAGTGPTGATDASVDTQTDVAEEDLVAHHLARAAAAEAARQRLGEDAAFALGVGILASVADIDQHAITLTAGTAELVARALDVLVAEQPEVRARARVILRVGPEVAGDLVRHRASSTLGLEPAQVTWTRWRGAARPDAVQLLVRIADPELAATVGGWVDTALDPAPEPATAWHA